MKLNWNKISTGMEEWQTRKEWWNGKIDLTEQKLKLLCSLKEVAWKALAVTSDHFSLHNILACKAHFGYLFLFWFKNEQGMTSGSVLSLINIGTEFELKFSNLNCASQLTRPLTCGPKYNGVSLCMHGSSFWSNLKLLPNDLSYLQKVL